MIQQKLFYDMLLFEAPITIYISLWICFAGSQPQLENSRNILLHWVSTSTWEFLKYLALLGFQPQFQNTWIIWNINSEITGFSCYLKKKKSDISTLMLFLYGYLCPVIYMALNAKMFYGGFMPQIFNDHQGVHATSNLRPRVDIFVMGVMPHHMSG